MDLTLILIGAILIAAALLIMYVHDVAVFGRFEVGASHPGDSLADSAEKSGSAPTPPPPEATRQPTTPPTPDVSNAGTSESPKSEVFSGSRAPAYPCIEAVDLPAEMPLEWACLKASVKGFNKDALQDAHEVWIRGETAVLVVCDGAGSKPRSKAGADQSAAFLRKAFADLCMSGASFDAESWRGHAEQIFLAATQSLSVLAAEQGGQLADYGCTAIVAIATETEVLCAHVGDGRAGYLDAQCVFKALMSPYKGAEANSTVFLTMLTRENMAHRLRTSFVRMRTKALVALSDGPENVCWHTSTMDQEGLRLTDPNIPSAKFFGKISRQLAGAVASKVPQDQLDKMWADFLVSGNDALAAETDDKTLLFALRG